MRERRGVQRGGHVLHAGDQRVQRQVLRLGAGLQRQLVSVELRRRRDPVYGRRVRRHDEQRAQLRRVRQRVPRRIRL